MTKQELDKIMINADKTVEAILGGKESIVLSAGRIMKDQKTILELGRMVIGMQKTLEEIIRVNDNEYFGKSIEGIKAGKALDKFGVKDE